MAAFVSLSDLLPAGRTPPGGERLAGTPADVKLQLYCEGKPAIFIGNNDSKKIDAVDPDWRSATELARELLQRSADITFLVLLAAGCLRTRTFSDFVECIECLGDLLETGWEHCLPALELDDNDEPTDAVMRVSAVLRLEESVLVAAGLEVCALERNPDGEVVLSLSHLPLSADSQSSVRLPTERLQAVLSKAHGDFQRLLAACSKIEFALRARAHGESAFELKNLREHIALLYARVAPSAEFASAMSGHGLVPGSGAGQAGAQAAAANSRESAIAALEQVIRYFEQAEPSSPLVPILRRARGLIGKDFWQIMEELGDQKLVDAVCESRVFKRS